MKHKTQNKTLYEERYAYTPKKGYNIKDEILNIKQNIIYI